MTLNEARAFARTMVTPDGKLWISGGAGKKKFLKTIEILKVVK